MTVAFPLTGNDTVDMWIYGTIGLTLAISVPACTGLICLLSKFCGEPRPSYSNRDIESGGNINREEEETRPLIHPTLGS